jgi:hypothetical protein
MLLVQAQNLTQIIFAKIDLSIHLLSLAIATVEAAVTTAYSFETRHLIILFPLL